MTSRNDRVEGVLLGTAAGDALGAPYEFGPPRGPELEVAMVGGGGWEPGEWTDDTSMAIAIAEVAATGADLRDAAAQDAIVTRWHEWSLRREGRGHPDAFGAERRRRETAPSRRRAPATDSAELHRAQRPHRGQRFADAHRAGGAGLPRRRGRDGGGGAGDQRADALRPGRRRRVRAVVLRDPPRGAHRKLDVRIGLRHLDSGRRELWAKRLDAAESSRPAVVSRTTGGWSRPLQAAWSAIATTPVPVDDPDAGVFRADHLRLALDAAVRAATTPTPSRRSRAGCSAPPTVRRRFRCEWRRLLHGWPGLTRTRPGGAGDCDRAQGHAGRIRLLLPRRHRSTRVVEHPYDDRVLARRDRRRCDELPEGVDAVVSLCRLADDDMRHDMPHVEVRLIDRTEHDENPHLDFVLLDAVRAVEQLRREGRTVLVHCVGAYSRTPTVAALYGARLRGSRTSTRHCATC